MLFSGAFAVAVQICSYNLNSCSRVSAVFCQEFKCVVVVKMCACVCVCVRVSVVVSMTARNRGRWRKSEAESGRPRGKAGERRRRKMCLVTRRLLLLGPRRDLVSLLYVLPLSNQFLFWIFLLPFLILLSAVSYLSDRSEIDGRCQKKRRRKEG